MIEENPIQFDSLIEQFKHDHFKGLSTVYSKHLYSCFNPADTNQIITLTYSSYPKDVTYK